MSKFLLISLSRVLQKKIVTITLTDLTLPTSALVRSEKPSVSTAVLPKVCSG